MFSVMPLLSGWQLEADELPDRLIPFSPSAGFTLPGADALSGFADLLGASDGEDAGVPALDEKKTAPFTLPAMLPDDVRGRASLSREIDFGRLVGERAIIAFEHICGRGRIELNGRVLYRFGEEAPAPGEIRLIVNDALRLCRKQTLTVRFDDAQGAGVPGAVFLRTTAAAHLTNIRLIPDALRRTLGVEAEFSALRRGHYVLRAALACPDDRQDAPWRETETALETSAPGAFSLSLSMPADRFIPGAPHAAPVVKLSLYFRGERDGKRLTLLDSVTRQTGYAGPAPRYFLPLTPPETRLDPDALIARAKDLGVNALLLPGPASDLLYRRCTLAGVALIAADARAESRAAKESPCASVMHDLPPLDAPSPAAACAQLCGMPALPAHVDPAATDAELLYEASGKRLDPTAPDILSSCKRLRALLIRLRAEAARQGQYGGPLCAPGEWMDEEIGAAIRAAFAPTHLSALPLRGAWWTLTQFSASLHVYAAGAADEPLTAEAALIAADGTTLAKVSKTCPGGGYAGLLSCALPDTACALTLKTRLLRGDTLVEEDALPVYVGERGPLEAAF